MRLAWLSSIADCISCLGLLGTLPALDRGIRPRSRSPLNVASRHFLTWWRLYSCSASHMPVYPWGFLSYWYTKLRLSSPVYPVVIAMVLRILSYPEWLTTSLTQRDSGESPRRGDHKRADLVTTSASTQRRLTNRRLVSSPLNASSRRLAPALNVSSRRFPPRLEAAQAREGSNSSSTSVPRGAVSERSGRGTGRGRIPRARR